MMRVCAARTPRGDPVGHAKSFLRSPTLRQCRQIRYSSIQETLQPIAGQSAGQMSIMNEICCNPDGEEERRKPVFRHEVAPLGDPHYGTRPSSTSSCSTKYSGGENTKVNAYLRTMYEWGYHSLTLFKKTNESPGPWWNANASTLVSNWSQVGDYANAGMWSSVWRYTYGVGEYNLRPATVRGRAWGYRVAASHTGAKGTPHKTRWALGITYGIHRAHHRDHPPHTSSRSANDGPCRADTPMEPPPPTAYNLWSETAPPAPESKHHHQPAESAPALQKLCFAHTPEHDRHRRIRNPPLPGFRVLSPLHGKRVLREVQYHLGQGLRFYLIDGVFGSEPSTATPYRVITDNPTHAFFITMAALRKFNLVAPQEVCLVKRIQQSPLDEWGWRRPGVLVYHSPCYDFEAPRIVEEFGGPRPEDVGLQHARFVALEPYSIPMKGVIGGEPSCEVLLQVTAFLCARWGFYADDKGWLTLPSDSLLQRRPSGEDGDGGGRVTLVIGASESEADELRRSACLYGCHHHRLGYGTLARAWDVVSLNADAASVADTHVHERGVQRRGSSSSSSSNGDALGNMDDKDEAKMAVHPRRKEGVSADERERQEQHEDARSRAHTSRRTLRACSVYDNDIQTLDLVEHSLGRVQRSLPTRMGLLSAHSHRFYHRRNVSSFGYKWPHRYSNDAATCAYAGGHLFRAPAKDELAGHMPRPRSVALSSVDVLILVPGHDNSGSSRDDLSKHDPLDEAAEAILAVLRARAFVYAQEHVLKKALTQMLESVRSFRVEPAGASARALLRDVAHGR